MNQVLLDKIELELIKAVPKKATAAWVEKYFNNSGAVDLKALDQALLAPMRDLLRRGGKRWRPYLLVICATALSDNPTTCNQAIAIQLSPVPELLHNATLIVDDFEDRSPTRRGGPAIHKAYGEDIAINAANFFYFYPMLFARLVAKGGSVPPLVPLSVATEGEKVIVEEMANVHLGQALDIFWHNSPDHGVAEANYFEMCRLKTGTMARLAARMGAIIAGAEPAQVKAVGSFAETLGVAFQIRDDLENISPSGRPGKAFGDDITEGKKSLPVIRALTQLNSGPARELKQILNSHTHERAAINRAVALISQTDALIYTKKTILACRQQALDILSASAVKNTGALADLASQIT